MVTITVGAEHVRDLVPMPRAITAVRAAFVAYTAGDFELPPRIALADGGFLSMAVHHRPSGTAAFKTLSLESGRDPAIVGSVIWSDRRHADQVVADAGAVTAIRTGAVIGVATDLLARPDATRCVVFGTGAQAADQLRAVVAVRPIAHAMLVGRDPVRADRLARALAAEFPGIAVEATTDAVPALAVADIVCCATSARDPLFDLAALPDRVHVNAIGSYRPHLRELPDDLLGAGLVVVDERGAVLEESGEIGHALATGLLDGPARLIELGHALVAGVHPTPRTTFKSVGLAIQDWAIARLLASALLE